MVQPISSTNYPNGQELSGDNNYSLIEFAPQVQFNFLLGALSEGFPPRCPPPLSSLSDSSSAAFGPDGEGDAVQVLHLGFRCCRRKCGPTAAAAAAAAAAAYLPAETQDKPSAAWRRRG